MHYLFRKISPCFPLSGCVLQVPSKGRESLHSSSCGARALVRREGRSEQDAQLTGLKG